MSRRDHLEPLSIFLSKKGGGGDRLLFRYPYSEPAKKNRGEDAKRGPERNPYALQLLAEELAVVGAAAADQDRLTERNIVAYPSKHLSNLVSDVCTHMR